jgi:hypothetical protein
VTGNGKPSRRAACGIRGVAVAIAVLAVAAGVVLYVVWPVGTQATPGPSVSERSSPGSGGQLPPPNGYFKLRPVGSYASLPDDAQAAAEVHRSTWEPRPDNTRYNHTVPVHLKLVLQDPATRAYDPRWNKYVLERITGNYTGTTDEIFQWAAAKWGLPDNLLRTVAYMESDWHQGRFGDRVKDAADCPPGFRRHLPCPVTFGIAGTRTTSWPGLYPWNHLSTAASVDALAGWLRGCYEGWVWWLAAHGNRSHGVYRAGDIWGCVGAWYSGNWLDGSPIIARTGESYIFRAKYWYSFRPWLRPGF